MSNLREKIFHFLIDLVQVLLRLFQDDEGSVC